MNLKFWTWDLWSYRKRLSDLREGIVKASNDLAAQQSTNFALIQQRDRERERADEEARQLRNASTDLGALRFQYDLLQQQVRASAVLVQLERKAVKRPDLLETLKAVTEETDWWRALHAALNERERMCSLAVCEAGLTSEEVHFRRGCLHEVKEARAEWLGWLVEVRREDEKGG